MFLQFVVWCIPILPFIQLNDFYTCLIIDGYTDRSRCCATYGYGSVPIRIWHALEMSSDFFIVIIDLIFVILKIGVSSVITVRHAYQKEMSILQAIYIHYDINTSRWSRFWRSKALLQPIYTFILPRYRVEVYNISEWGAVVGNWTLTNAEVVCHQLGFEISSKTRQFHIFFVLLSIIILKGGAVSLDSSYYSNNRGPVPVHMSDVLCSGTESRLTDCPHNPGGNGTTQEFATQMCSYSFDSDCNFYLLYTFSRLLSSTSIILFYTSTAAAITKQGLIFVP